MGSRKTYNFVVTDHRIDDLIISRKNALILLITVAEHTLSKSVVCQIVIVRVTVSADDFPDNQLGSNFLLGICTRKIDVLIGIAKVHYELDSAFLFIT